MKPAPSRLLASAAVLALALVLGVGQLALGHTGVLAGALAAALAAHGHGHAVSVLTDGGHLDVVLHHDDETAQPGETPIGFGAHDGDHVVHALGADGVRDGSRRSSPPVVLAGFAAPSPAPPAAGALAKPAPVASPPGSTLLRTTVLRI